MLQAKIRNVLGIETATLALSGLTLVAGLNGSGKSSLIQAVAAAALGDWHIRGITHKRDGVKVVRRGSETGAVLLEYPGGSSRVSWPAGDVTQTGAPLSIGTPLGIGAVRFSSLPADKRLLEITRRFQTAPTREDFDAWFRSHGAAGVDPDEKPQEGKLRAIDVLWEDIVESGWEAISKRMDGAVRNLQGAWQEVTGARWGSKLRLEWAPIGLHRGEPYSLADANAAVAAAKATLEQTVAANAVGAAERERWKADADMLPQRARELAEATAARDALDAEVELMVETIDANPVPADPAGFPPCPHCGNPLHIQRAATGMLFVEQAPPRVDPAAYEAAVRERQALHKAVMEKRGEASLKVREVMQCEAAVSACKRAAEAYAEAEDQPIVDDGAMVAARMKLTEAERHQSSVRALERAIQINAEWEATKALADAVANDGIRNVVLHRRMSEIAAQLSDVAEKARFAEVGLSLDGSLSYGGTAYDMCSESEQWRCDFVMGLVLARREGAGLFLADRMDVLHPQAFPGALRALAALGCPVLVTMTCREPARAPDLGANKLGTTLWLGGGQLQEIASTLGVSHA